jgi:hypothetical protein
MKVMKNKIVREKSYKLINKNKLPIQFKIFPERRELNPNKRL